MAVFLLLGVVLSGLAISLAPLVVGWFDLAPALQAQAIDALKWLGLLVLLALLNGAVVALLQANHRFGRLTVSTAAAQLAYVAASLVLLRPGDAVEVLVWVLAIRYVVGLIVGFAAARRLVRFRRPLLPGRAERAAFRAYAGRMQLSSMTSFFNGEVDALVVAALLPVRYVGIFAAAHQVASAARSLPLLRSPRSSPLSRTHSPVAASRRADRVRPDSGPLAPAGPGLRRVAVAPRACCPIWLGDDFHSLASWPRS